MSLLEKINEAVSKWKLPREKLSWGVVLNDEGVYWCTQTFYFKATDTEEEFLKKAKDMFNIYQNCLITTHA